MRTTSNRCPGRPSSPRVSRAGSAASDPLLIRDSDDPATRSTQKPRCRRAVTAVWFSVNQRAHTRKVRSRCSR
ncbi:hypothetical protein GS881_17115 [Rhodococcus hoagii]|nr:hypothetical protein [Prescottella equi]